MINKVLETLATLVVVGIPTIYIVATLAYTWTL